MPEKSMPAKANEKSQKNISNKLVNNTGEIIELPKNVISKQTNTADSDFQKQMYPLGFTPGNNKFLVLKKDINNREDHEDIQVEIPCVEELPSGDIVFNFVSIDGYQVTTKKSGSKGKIPFQSTRLKTPINKSDGSSIRYLLPKGGGTPPWIHPQTIDKYQNKKSIPTLYFTEGIKKAAIATFKGCDTIAFNSITCMKDLETGKLHPDIVKLIKTCQVKKAVWLTDGDAIDITHKELTDGLDLSKRPKQFYGSVSTFKTLFDEYEDLEKWFFHIDRDSILSNNPGINREDVKGIDDLLITLNPKEKDIISDLKSVQPGNYFQKFNVTHGTGKVYNHFHLRDVKDFYLFHVERRPELKNSEFTFNGTRYQYNEETGDCDVKIPGAAKLYFRAGDDYYKFIEMPNQYSDLERTFHQRKKTTITDDHGTKFLKYISKYEAFCNVPNHYNFQQVIHNCFNVYSPLDFQPEETECSQEDCPSIINLIRHLFGEKIVSYQDRNSKQNLEYKTFELGLDYLQLLYQRPQQKLPILCLVSKENNTGKTTFANLLRMMLGANTAIVGNADLQNDFNAHWATKSVVVCDETKIDKTQVVDKIKNLSTARKIFMNAKGRGQIELDCFIKFILITNNEDNFIYATDEDIRYWVIKVPVLKQENPTILDLFKEEMPAFLSFINKRKIATKLENRMWFHPDLIKTEALQKVIDKNKSGLEKEISYFFHNLFLATGKDELFMTCKNIIDVMKINTSKWGTPYVEKVLKDDLKLNVCRKFKIDVDKSNKFYEVYKDKKYKTTGEAVVDANKIFPGLSSEEIITKIKTVNVNKQYEYPFYDVSNTIQWKKDNGKAYILKRKKFLAPEDELEPDLDSEEKTIMDDQPF